MTLIPRSNREKALKNRNIGPSKVRMFMLERISPVKEDLQHQTKHL